VLQYSPKAGGRRFFGTSRWRRDVADYSGNDFFITTALSGPADDARASASAARTDGSRIVEDSVSKHTAETTPNSIYIDGGCCSVL
jgi:hypothetical protein